MSSRTLLSPQQLQENSKKIDELVASRDLTLLKEFLSDICDNQYENPKDQAFHYYTIGTGYAETIELGPELWSKDAIGKAVSYFRRSIFSSGFKLLDPELASRIYINLGNAYSKQGRALEALHEYNTATLTYQNPITLLNKGVDLLRLSLDLSYADQCIRFQKEAYETLSFLYLYKTEMFAPEHVKLMESDGTTISFLDWYSQTYGETSEHFPELDNSNSKGRSGKERRYRKWCLTNRLYINEANDISDDEKIGQDTLCFPSLIKKLNPLISTTESLALSASFSEIKYQYAFARHNYFESITSVNALSEKQHFADKNLRLTNSLDYCIYRRDTEQLKVSFRLFYSCFDKIALLLKKYLLIDIGDHRVSFSTVWFKEQKHKTNKAKGAPPEIRDFFIDNQNPFFLALYWLSRDINDNEEDGHNYWMDTNAQKLADIRNKMEHQGFRVVMESMHRINSKFDSDRTNEAITEHKSQLDNLEALLAASDDPNTQTIIKDRINAIYEFFKEREHLNGYPLTITDSELKEQTMRLMKKLRYALIYLALGINLEEQKKRPETPLMQLEVPLL
ncbi:hypothetical protein HX786_02705 [Pseudomonas sp. 21615526]|uniref:LA2681 family HEPN domain-containing protein n=1 Tax=Pseudomonas sp. 21615526 TaxID=2738811 RepID=UPI0015C0F4B6|nr:LA2681 family HEPN domain-containing protein [Pseudomonas sp. 21615526]NVZ36969.1 hypothetical protein [Pseudomonas sp. 21615526]